MNSRTESTQKLPDALKWAASVAVLIAAIGAFYYFGETSTLLRVIVLLVAVGMSVFIASKTETGEVAWEFVRESRTEVRKVVWPTRRETLQTTGLVIAMVTVVAIILWALDSVLAAIMRSVMSVGGS
jgi:preprotein translocase subunit SecE